MKNIFLISCTARKQEYRCKVEEMYQQSTLFKASFQYALSRVEDKESQIFILSAKHGLISLSKVINPYDMTIKKFNKKERVEWGEKVFEQMGKLFDIQNTHIIFLAGSSYMEPLKLHLDRYNCEYSNPIPVENRALGKRIKWLRENVEEK